MGMGKFRPPGAPKPLNAFWWNLEYITTSGVWTTHANPHGAATTWVVSANMWHVTCFGFSVQLFSFYYFILGIVPSPHCWTDFDDLYVIWRVSAQGSAFWGSRWHNSPFRGLNPPKSPILGAWIGVFKPLQNSKSCILSKLLYRLQPIFAQW